MSFFLGFEKTAAAKWQKMWGTMSDVSKQRLRRYSGAGVRDLPAMREGMMMPRYNPAEVARRNTLDEKLYQNALRNNPDVRTIGYNATPYAYKGPGEKGYMALPTDPSRGNKTRAITRPDLSGATGTHNRGMLEHETTELNVERMKGKRNPLGKDMRTHKAIQESSEVVHSSAHPLIAEANIAARNPKTLRDTRAMWSETPAQGQMYRVLKQNGWTPASGLPVYGRQANAVQRQAETIFAPHYQGMLTRQLRAARNPAAKKELVRGSKEFAGGGAAKG